ncbi:MAG: FG-GAP-like repeat-containing protein [Verrucomicrobiota bacterium]
MNAPPPPAPARAPRARRAVAPGWPRGLAWLLLASLMVVPGLHALEWEAGNGFRRAKLTPAQPGRTGFIPVPATLTGITFTNTLSASRYLTNQIYLNGSGLAAGDVDGDGLCDLFICGIERPCALYRNLGGWRFEDITAQAGVGLTNLSATGAVFADLDGDGHLDLIVNTLGNGTFVFLNDGKGHFTDAFPGAPLNYLRAGMTAALADVDGNGTLDLYVANYRRTTYRDMSQAVYTLGNDGTNIVVKAVGGRPTTEPDLVGRFTATADHRIVENGEPDVLYLNDGHGHFTVVPFTGGAFLDEDGRPLAAPPYDWGLTATFRDINDDGAPDIYVCNDFESPDRIWINDGHGHFRALPRLAMRQTSLFSMGVDFADLNRDGHPDFFVSDMLSRQHERRMLELGEIQPTYLPIGAIENRPQYSHNTLFVNRGDSTFAEISQFAGVQASEWTWSPNFLDVDLDGYEDLLITTGHQLQMMNADVINQAQVMKSQKAMTKEEWQQLRALFPHYRLPKVAFRNRGDLTFEEVGEQWGFATPGVGNAMVMADLDNDGALDVVVNNLNGPVEVLRNQTGAPRLAVRLKGRSPNTQGIGAKITVFGGAVPMQSQEVICGGHYLSGSDPLRVFAAGSPTNRMRLEVRWRDGRRSVVEGVEPNYLYELDEAAAQPLPETPPARPAPWFEDVSHLLGHHHHEDPFDDFARQSLLPNRLSQLGPGVAWSDVDGDGWDDLFIASGRGGQFAGFRNRGDGTFEPMTGPLFSRVVARDQTTVLGLGPTLIVGSSNYEDGQTNGGSVRIYDLARQAGGESVMGPIASTGPLAFGDIDGSGDLALFVGGRVVPGRYPEPATSLLLRRQAGRLVPAQRFENVGLVTGAVFSDLDGDGLPELILACEWGPVRIYRNQDGKFTEWNAPITWRDASAASPRPATLSQMTGWWTGVATGDLDGDGRLDIVVANWGLNSRYRPTPERPIRIHYGDFDGSGGVDIIESYFNPASGKEVPTRGLRSVQPALPFIQERITSYEAYGKATLAEIYGDRLQSGRVVEANTLASMILFNRGDHFEAVPLPAEAQWAPAFGVCIGDADGDGAEDIFLSQNFFDVNPDDWRHDAGRGLWLRGDGRGQFTPVAGQVSGVMAYGEQRGCALGDYDRDGRLDLVVTQNGAKTKLYHNLRAKPGLRVRLDGGAGNPTAVGAWLRLEFGGHAGPAHEIQAGSGYWSQNSPVAVLATPEAPTALRVRWPGGKTTTNAVPDGAREILVGRDGSVKLVK